MFIAVINENFQVAEEAKKEHQATSYWASYQAEIGKPTWIRKLNPYRWVKANPVKVKVENLPPNLVLPIQKALVQDYAIPKQDKRSEPVSFVVQNIIIFAKAHELSISQTFSVPTSSQRGPRHYPSKSLTALQRLFAGDPTSYDIPLTTLRHARNDMSSDANIIDEETERHL
jgi:voltage-dependent calcium channel